MTVTLEGHLTQAAEKRVDVLRHDAIVVLAVHVGPGYHAEARLQFRQDHFKAEAVAQAARRGALVCVEAEGFFPRTDHSTAAIVLSNVKAASIDGTPVFP